MTCLPGTTVELNLYTDDELERELCVARLNEWSFNGYAESDERLQAYIGCEAFDGVKDDVMEWLLQRALRHDIALVEPRNWNEEWEKSFEPVVIEGKICIRADFHPRPTEKNIIDLVVNPKMSFGTGHHDTTAMMMKYMLGIDLRDADVLDLGCGTGILSLLASKRNAKTVTAIDNDPQACINAQENNVQNLVTNVDVKLGDISVVADQTFDCVLANINRNVLLGESARIYSAMRPGATLLLSGVLNDDKTNLINTYQAFNLVLTGSLSTQQWAALCFKKP